MKFLPSWSGNKLKKILISVDFDAEIQIGSFLFALLIVAEDNYTLVEGWLCSDAPIDLMNRQMFLTIHRSISSIRC